MLRYRLKSRLHRISRGVVWPCFLRTSWYNMISGRFRGTAIASFIDVLFCCPCGRRGEQSVRSLSLWQQRGRRGTPLVVFVCDFFSASCPWSTRAGDEFVPDVSMAFVTFSLWQSVRHFSLWQVSLFAARVACTWIVGYCSIGFLLFCDTMVDAWTTRSISCDFSSSFFLSFCPDLILLCPAPSTTGGDGVASWSSHQ